MKDLTTSELAKLLREKMEREGLSLNAAVLDLGFDYNQVYRRLSKGGYKLRYSLVRVRRPAPSAEVRS